MLRQLTKKNLKKIAIAISSSTSLLRSGTNMDSLQQNLDEPELGETSFEDILPFPTIGEKTKRKRTKAINTDTRLLTSKEYQNELGSYLDNKKKKQTKNVQEKNHADPEKKKKDNWATKCNKINKGIIVKHEGNKL